MRPSLRFAFVVVSSFGLACAAGSGDGRVGDLGIGTDFGAVDASAVADSAVADGFGSADATTASEDASAVDMSGAADAGAPDGFRIDMGPIPCASDGECDDGDGCNGAETCAAGTCVGGTPLDCNDGVSCTIDGCSSSRCTHSPDDSLCAGALSCDPATGCVDTSCTESPCRLVTPQCGCPTDQACALAGDGTRSCQLEGRNDESERCDSGGCVAGTACVDVSLTTADVPLCKRFCDSDADCSAGPGSICLAELGMTGQNVCTSSCEPASQIGCPANSFCGLFTEMGSGRRLTDCSGPVGAGGQGTPCAGSEDCQKGFTCADPGTGDQCMRWCRRSPVGGECALGQTCIGFTDPLVFDSTEYGVCL